LSSPCNRRESAGSARSRSGSRAAPCRGTIMFQYASRLPGRDKLAMRPNSVRETSGERYSKMSLRFARSIGASSSPAASSSTALQCHSRQSRFSRMVSKLPARSACGSASPCSPVRIQVTYGFSDGSSSASAWRTRACRCVATLSSA
jgi:hypothetical protein